MSESISSEGPGRTGAPQAARRPGATAGRVALIALAVLAGLAFVVGAHAYLVRRLVVDPALPEPLATGLTAAIGLLAATLFLQPLAERLAPARVEHVLVWPAAIWMGVAFLLLVALGATDLLLGLLGAAGDPDPVTAARVRAAVVAATVAPVALLALRQGLARPSVRKLTIPLARWPAALDGFRIVQISDIHFGPILGADFAAWLRDRIDALSPDLIAITGDLVDGTVSKVGGVIEPLRELRAPYGRWFVTGNHDHYSGARSWTARIAELGITVLRNEHVVLQAPGEAQGEADGARFVLAGVDDHRSRQMPGEGGEDLEAALSGVDPALPVILLAHDPTTFRRASERGVDLQLSGHTHGGQIWPFRYLVRLAMPWVAGLYRRGPAVLYVSRGTGFWGPPMRLGAPAEITEIELRSSE